MKKLDSFSVEGKHAIIVGATGGIGQAIAKTFANAGCRVTLTGRSIEKLQSLIESHDFKKDTTHIARLDILDLDSIQTVFSSADHIQPIDIAVICAGVSARHEIVDMPESDYRKIVSTNLDGTWNSAKVLGTLMIPRKEGKVILFGSITSHFGMKYAAAYAASKGAVVQLAKSLAIEWAEHNIQVNTIAPGFVETEMTKVSLSIPERRKWILDRTPAKRLGKPDEIASATLFLASPGADFITGHVLYVDGGFMAGSQW
jgi:NAD(P)-dependent dehydrogenase (short-subunit alcohol dehydrogenase family)